MLSFVVRTAPGAKLGDRARIVVDWVDVANETTVKRGETFHVRIAAPAQAAGVSSYLQYWFVVVGGYDIAATGSRAAGAVGDVVKVNLGVTNVGDATIDAPHDHYVRAAWTYTFTPPPGTEIVTAPNVCAPFTPPSGLPYYRCQNLATQFEPGDAQTWSSPSRSHR